jgi:hypothetical protein
MWDSVLKDVIYTILVKQKVERGRDIFWNRDQIAFNITKIHQRIPWP